VRDFSTFLKKRSTIAEEHASSLKRLCRATYESFVRNSNEGRAGTYSSAVQGMTTLQERIADNHNNFALSLHQMYEDLNELGNHIDRGRRDWKSRGLAAEAKVTSAEAAAEKAQSKYNNLAEDLERVKTGEKAGKSFGFKGIKTGSQHEGELLRKVQAADEDYSSKVQYSQSQRRELVQILRPQAIKALTELCTECDIALMAIMQKYGKLNLFLVVFRKSYMVDRAGILKEILISITAAYNEKLVLSNGTTISPLPEDNQRGLRDLVASVDNAKDFHGYIRAFAPKVPQKSGELEYRKHPVGLRHENRHFLEVSVC